MLNWLFKYYVTALRWGSAPPPGKCGVLVWGPLLGSEARPPPGRSHEQPESQLRHAAFRRWVRGPAPHPRRCACCDEEEEEEREATALHILGAPGPSAPDITPTCHGMPSAGAGGHEIFMGDDRETGLGRLKREKPEGKRA